MNIETLRDVMHAHFWLAVIATSVVVYVSSGGVELIVFLSTTLLPSLAIVVSAIAKEIDISISDKIRLIIMVVSFVFVVICGITMFLYKASIHAILIYLITFFAFIGIMINFVIPIIARKKQKKYSEGVFELARKNEIIQTIIIVLLLCIMMVDTFVEL